MSLACLLAFHACSNNDEPAMPPPSKGEEAVNQIVEVLEEQTEISTFVEVLKTIDVANLEEDKLTVFAVRNADAGTRASEESLDSVSIKRHIALGSYRKTELTDGMTLKSINGEDLYVSRPADEEVRINGVPIEGEAIKAGNSYVYIIPEVLAEQRGPIEKRYATTISVQALWVGGQPYMPLEGVVVTVFDGAGSKLGEWTTDATGEVVVEHTAKAIVYQIQREGYSEYHNGYLLEDIAPEGGYRYVDFNGDGIWDANDMVDTSEPYRFSLDYKELDVTETKQVCYMWEVTPARPEVDVTEMKEAWKAAMQAYYANVLTMERVLFTGSEEYTVALKSYSEPLWTAAYSVLDRGKEYAKLLDGADGDDAAALLDDISVDRMIVRTQLYGHYGQLLDDSDLVPAEQLAADLEQAIVRAPSQAADAMRLLLAKVYAEKGDWNRVLESCRSVIDRNSYRLTSLYAPTKDEMIWNGGSVNLGGSDAPVGLLFREAYLLAAVAGGKLGRQQEYDLYINLLKTAFAELAETDTTTDAGVAALANRLLQGNGGQLYPYYRILQMPIPVAGFDTFRHYLLPVPDSALWMYTFLKQNPGY